MQISVQSRIHPRRFHGPVYTINQWRKVCARLQAMRYQTNMAATTQNILPIISFRNSLLKAIESSKALVIVGETGSGKTTQLPQFLYQAGSTKIHCSRKIIILRLHFSPTYLSWCREI